jgi:hypothetical protein
VACGGRITVTAKKIKITEGDSVAELQLNSEEEFLVALEKYFHIRLNDSIPFANASLA